MSRVMLQQRRTPGATRFWLATGLLVLTCQAARPACADAPPHTPVDTSADAPEISFQPCQIGDTSAKLAARCATLNLPLHGLRKPGGDDSGIVVHVAHLPARSRQPQADPLVLIAGGPGQAASEAFPPVLSAFRHLREQRDLYLVDQRGTGRSTLLGCPDQAHGQADGHGGEQDHGRGIGPSFSGDPQQVRALTEECLQSLDEDPRWFTTSLAVDDLERVRRRLGIDTWNLYGVSYGTRVAQHYTARYPGRVRSLILDAVVPADVALGPQIAVHAQQALDQILQRCAAAPACNTAFPELAGRLQAFLDDLRTAPRQVRFEDIQNGTVNTVEFDAMTLAGTLRLMSYSAWGASILPALLDQAIREDHLAPLARQAELQARSLGTSLALGMHNSVVCTEDLPFAEPLVASEQAQTYLGSAMVETLEAVCEIWPAGERDASLNIPLTGDTPTLVLSGGADPITPPAWGERVASHLPNAHHIVNPGQGHMQAPLGCVPSIMARFIDTPGARTLDTQCIGRLAPPAFFIDANGPTP